MTVSEGKQTTITILEVCAYNHLSLPLAYIFPPFIQNLNSIVLPIENTKLLDAASQYDSG